MNVSRCMQTTDCATYETPFGYCDVTVNRSCAESAFASDVRGAAESLRQYATHLELLLLRKNNEVNELRSIMTARVEEERHKQLENERIIIHQARHSAMGEVLGIIAHQWRQPLHGISLVIQNIMDAWEYGELGDEILNRSVNTALGQVMYLSQTINDFCTFLSPVKTMEQFNPVLCVNEIVGLLSGWFSDLSTIDVQKWGVIEENFLVTGCQDEFKHVIFNLLDNSNDAIQAKQHRIGPAFRGRIIIDFQRRDDDAVIVVADNGGGIAESAMEHIFKPYFTTKTKASGIGLYTSKLIIENCMNGSLWAENIPEGALFGIRLPLMIADGGAA